MNKIPTISVIIPVKNEGTKIRACIEGILSQTIPVTEIIVIDSGSTDDTLSILKEFSIVKVIEIPGSEFNHGATRNLGVRNATGEFLLFTVGDARAYDNLWIEHMLKGFDGDDNIAGVCGLQIVPHERDKNPAEWFRPASKPQIVKHVYTEEEFNALTPFEKKVACSWDDVTTMYKRDIMLNKVPFQPTTYGEDILWAKDAIRAGYAIVYNTAARVYHYHLEDGEFTFKRSFTVIYHWYKLWDYVTEVPEFNLMYYLKLANVLRKAEGLSASEKIKWWKYNLELKAAIKKAIVEFHKSLQAGEDNLDKRHTELCGKPPIPKKQLA